MNWPDFSEKDLQKAIYDYQNRDRRFGGVIVYRRCIELKFNSRYLGAVVLAPLLIFVFLGGLPLKLFTIALSVCGLYEFYNALKTKEIKSIPIISYILLVVYYVLNNNFENIMYILVITIVYII